MANTQRTQSRTPAVPQPGSRPSIRVDAELSDDLAVIMRTGGTTTDAVRAAVAHLAMIYRTAWAHGIVPSGTVPTLAAFQYAERPTPRAPLTSQYAPLSDTRPTHGTGYRLPGGHPVHSVGPVVAPAARA
ncbi:hypothetical protein [Streptomyces nitrosporeus]|uniref:hypothetical protein n=1 Tax=Streptomyces nitrosporeus TaxID=28894 RepID=UPI0039A04B7D